MASDKLSCDPSPRPTIGPLTLSDVRLSYSPAATGSPNADRKEAQEAHEGRNDDGEELVNHLDNPRGGLSGPP
jgi:hypothetical protein